MGHLFSKERKLNLLNWLKGKNLKVWLVVSLSGVLLAYTIIESGIEWGSLKMTPSQLFFLIAAMLVLLISIWVQSLRVAIPWHIYFKSKNPETLSSLLIGSFYNDILPGNLGEIMRARHFSNKNNTSFIRSLASQFVEKYIDALNFIIYAAFFCFLYKDSTLSLNNLIALVVIITVIFVLYLAIITSKKMERFALSGLFHFFSPGRFLYKLHYNIKLFLLSLTCKKMLNYLLFGYFMFALNIVQYYLVMYSVNLPKALVSLKIAFGLAVAMIVVYIIPSAPGKTGVVHFSIYTVMYWFAISLGLPETLAVKQSLATYAIYVHLSYFVPEVIVGALVVLNERKRVF